MPNINKINVNNTDYDIAASLLSPGSYINGQLYKGNNDIKNRFVCTTAADVSEKVVDTGDWKSSTLSDLWVNFENTNTASSVSLTVGSVTGPVAVGDAIVRNNVTATTIMPGMSWQCPDTNIIMPIGDATFSRSGNTWTRTIITSGTPVSGTSVLLNLSTGVISGADGTIAGSTCTLSYIAGDASLETDYEADKWYHFLWTGLLWKDLRVKYEDWTFILSDYTSLKKPVAVGETKPLYNITATVGPPILCAPLPNNPGRIQQDNSASLTFEALPGAIMGASLITNPTNATLVSYTRSEDQKSATAVIANPTGNVTISFPSQGRNNLMLGATYKSGITLISSKIYGAGGVNGAFYFSTVAGQTYTVVKNLLRGSLFRVGFTTAVPASGMDLSAFQENNSGDVITVTAPTGSKYLVIQVHNGASDVDGDIHEEMQKLMSAWNSSTVYGYNLIVDALSPNPGGNSNLYIKLNLNANGGPGFTNYLPTSQTDCSVFANKTDTSSIGILSTYSGATLTDPITLKYITDITIWADNNAETIATLNDDILNVGSIYSSALKYNVRENSTLKLKAAKSS